MKLIDKVTVVAEIEKRLKGLEDCHADRIAGYAGEISGLKRLLSFLDTLEVKEVGEEPVSKDLEEAACEYDNSHIDDNNLAFKAGAQWQKKQEAKKMDIEKEFDDYTKDILACDVQFKPFTHLHNCAKYFYELGLKAKGE